MYEIQAQPKTAKQIHDLKVDWLGDPSWDIEDTMGFELYYYELRAYRETVQKIDNEREAERLEGVAKGLGCSIELVGYIEHLERQIQRLKDVVGLA